MNSSIQAARTLWSICFPDDDADFLDFYFSKVARAEDTYLEYNQDGLAVAHIGIIRSEYFPRIKQPKRIKLAYIWGMCAPRLSWARADAQADAKRRRGRTQARY